ncbi:putative inorganic phosphate cotransporter [Eupeodes corollae]|uniref:putative inorganic phosphate cotransporter n=1 Tax=Eupeodes corollae TaxID=290404 RepID=UPI002490E778|nr:putative inorganic phosphate cotransporter [Eupeodes corollae]
MTDKTNTKGLVIGVRHLQALMLFLCFVVNFIDRLNTAVAVVAMTDAETANPNFPEYDWDKKQKSYVQSSFYWGLILTQIPGSFLCHKYGAKITMFVSTFGSAVLSLITPVCIPLGGWQIYAAITMIQGMFQGFFTPCIHEHIAKWSPIEERNRLGAFAHTGIEMGTILAMGVPGFIAQSAWGWPGISYVSGGLSIAWCIMWTLFADNDPNISRFISSEEKEFILSSQQKVDHEQKKIPIPWKALLTSVPFLTLVVAQSAQAWGFKTIQGEIPSYLHGVLRMDLSSNSIFSALPYLVMFVMTYIYLVTADILMKKFGMPLTRLRRTINSISMWVPAALLIGVGFLGESQKTLAVTLMTMTVGINGGDTIGAALNAIDLSPNHAATLIGIINTAMSAVFMATPLVVGVIVGDGTERSEWQIVFLITAIILFFGNLLYIFFGTTDTQPWDHEEFLLNKTVLSEKTSNGTESYKKTLEETFETKIPIDGNASHI